MIDRQIIIPGHKHRWHFKREYSEGERYFAEFICDKCGETKEVEEK